MKVFAHLSPEEAKQKLNELVSFDRIMTPKLSNPTYRDIQNGVSDMRDSILYFMSGKSDVAYYLVINRALCIQDTLRPWSDEFIAQMAEIS